MKEKKERKIDIIGFFRDLASTTPSDEFLDEEEPKVVFDGTDAEIVEEANANVRQLEKEFEKSIKVLQNENKKKNKQSINMRNGQVQNIKPEVNKTISNSDREYGE